MPLTYQQCKGPEDLNRTSDTVYVKYGYTEVASDNVARESPTIVVGLLTRKPHDKTYAFTRGGPI